MSKKTREDWLDAAAEYLSASRAAQERGDAAECDRLMECMRTVMRAEFPLVGAYSADPAVRAAHWKAYREGGEWEPEPAPVSYPNPYTAYTGYGPDQDDAAMG